MNREELKHIIDAVTREVLNRLKGEIESQHEEKACSKPKDKLLLVFTGGTENLEAVLSSLRQLSKTYGLLAAFTPAAEMVIGKERVRQTVQFEEVTANKLHDAISEAKAIIFPTLTQNTAAKAAAGIRDSVASEAMACGLLLKKKVIAVTDSVVTSYMPPAYGRMVNEILKRIEQLGVCLCRAQDLVRQISCDDKPPMEAASQCCLESRTLVLQEKVPVTAEIIFQAAQEGYQQITLLPNTIVTPMARDAAKDKNIILEWAVK